MTFVLCWPIRVCKLIGTFETVPDVPSSPLCCHIQFFHGYDDEHWPVATAVDNCTLMRRVERLSESIKASERAAGNTRRSGRRGEAYLHAYVEQGGRSEWQRSAYLLAMTKTTALVRLGYALAIIYSRSIINTQQRRKYNFALEYPATNNGVAACTA